MKHSIRFCDIFPSLKQNFIAYCSSKVFSRPDCIFEIHQLWQSGFSRVHSNCCCSCSFEPEIIKIGQSSHKINSNKNTDFSRVYDNFTCLNKKVLFNSPCIYIYIYIYIYMCVYVCVCVCGTVSVVSLVEYWLKIQNLWKCTFFSGKWWCGYHIQNRACSPCFYLKNYMNLSREKCMCPHELPPSTHMNIKIIKYYLHLNVS